MDNNDYTEDELIEFMKKAKPSQSGLGSDWNVMESMAYRQNQARSTAKVPFIVGGLGIRTSDSQYF